MTVIPNRVRVVALMSALALVLGLLAWALLEKPAQAQPPSANGNSGATVEEYPIDFTVQSTPSPDDSGGCGVFGEYIRVEGTWRIVTHSSTDSAGGIHFYSRSSVHATGTGYTLQDDGTYTPSGNKYVIVSSEGDLGNYLPPGQVNQGTILLNVWVQKGPGTPGDETITKKVGTYTGHFIYYPDGTVKLESVEFTDQCH